jgi:hypothetical protein
VLSTIAFTLNTLPDFKRKKLINITNQTNETASFKNLIHENGYTYILIENQIFDIIESICIAWFTVEFLLRFWASPNKIKFLKGFLNLIDLIAILPYFASILLSQQRYINFEKFNYVRLDKREFLNQLLYDFLKFRRVLLVFRVLRILRILKLARHSTGLQSLGYTLKKSHRELGILLMFLAIGVKKLLFKIFIVYESFVFLGFTFF